MIVVADSDGQQVPNCARLDLSMESADLFTELVAMYRKHGWQLRRALLRPETRVELQSLLPEDSVVKEGEFDALWFSRPSHNDREAWELRLLAQTQYALFETFEADETEEERDDLRLEMEARLREYFSHGA
jgi:hypothetical protein